MAGLGITFAAILGVVSCSSSPADQDEPTAEASTSATATSTETIGDEAAFLPPGFSGEIQPSSGRFGPVEAITLSNDEDYDRITIRYEPDSDGGVTAIPGLWVDSISDPRHPVTGKPLSLEGEAFIQISITGTTWEPEDPDASPTVEGLDNGQSVDGAEYFVESGGSSILVVGLTNANTSFRVFSQNDNQSGETEIVVDFRHG